MPDQIIVDERGKEGDYVQVLDALRYERDALRAENEQLKAPITNEWGQTLTPYNYLIVQLDVARAENERLRAAIEDAVSVLEMEGRPATLEPRASLERALGRPKAV